MTSRKTYSYFLKIKKIYAKILLILLIVQGLVYAQEGAKVKKATFAAGCFWGVEKILGALAGVVETQVGYAGGHTANPTYEEVTTGRTGHAESVEITYDPAKISYEKLLLTFWQYHDPTTRNQQGPDIGSQYRSVIFVHDEEQRKIAQEQIKILEDAKIFKRPIVTEVVSAGTFYRAEEYHQRYLKKNPHGYCSHHFQSAKISEALRTTVPDF